MIKFEMCKKILIFFEKKDGEGERAVRQVGLVRLVGQVGQVGRKGAGGRKKAGLFEIEVHEDGVVVRWQSSLGFGSRFFGCPVCVGQDGISVHPVLG